jgi:hypothetical protein
LANTYSCVACTASVFAVGRASVSACTCVSATLMQWSNALGQCECKTANSVIFVSASKVYTCAVCNATIFAKAKTGPAECSCISADFVWKNNVGCVCNDPTAVIIGTGAAAKCLVCN